MGTSAIAKKIAQAKARSGGVYINPAISGELTVLSLKDGDKPEFQDGATFVAEFLVDACVGLAGVKGMDKGKEIVKPTGNPVGSQCSYLCQFDEFPDVAFVNAKTFVLGLLDESDETLAEAAKQKLLQNPLLKGADGGPWNGDDEFAAAYDMLVDRKKNPARGMRIRYTTYEKETKKGNLITVPKWEPVKQTEDEIKARRAQLDGAAPAAPKTA